MVSGEGDGGGTGGKESNLASSRERYGDTARASATEAPGDGEPLDPRRPPGNRRGRWGDRSVEEHPSTGGPARRRTSPPPPDDMPWRRGVGSERPVSGGDRPELEELQGETSKSGRVWHPPGVSCAGRTIPIYISRPG